jgi:hypothetical protein
MPLAFSLHPNLRLSASSAVKFRVFFCASSRLKLLSPRIKSADGMSARFWSAPVLWRFSTVFTFAVHFRSFPCCVEPLCFPRQMPPLSGPSGPSAVNVIFACGYPVWLPLHLRGTRQDRRLSRMVRAGGYGTQQQGRASSLCETGLDEDSISGRLRAESGNHITIICQSFSTKRGLTGFQTIL